MLRLASCSQVKMPRKRARLPVCLLIIVQGAIAMRRTPSWLAPRSNGRAVKVRQLSVAKTPLALVNAESCPKYYTRRLTEPDLAILKQGVLMDAARCDAKSMRFASTDDYLHSINVAMKSFFLSRELCDRECMTSTLVDTLAEEGSLCMLLGGKSYGKTLLLDSIDGLLTDKQVDVLYLDARKTGADLSEGIMTAVSEDAAYFDQFLEASKKVAPAIAQMLVKLALHSDLPVISDDFMEKPPAAVDALRAFAEAAAQRGEHPCVIIDEADVVFSGERGRSNKAVLDLFVRLTKEQRALSVLLVSSDTTFPFVLERSMGFHLLDLTRVVHAAEVPPKEMRALLTDRWRLGDQLADCLLGCAGGHIMLAQRMLSQLMWRRDEFTPFMVEQLSISTSITRCLRAEATHAGMIDLMCELAETGFAPIEELSDPRVLMLLNSGIAGVATCSSRVLGLPPSIWTRADGLRHGAGLIPASQMVRLIILERILCLDSYR